MLSAQVPFSGLDSTTSSGSAHPSTASTANIIDNINCTYVHSVGVVNALADHTCLPGAPSLPEIAHHPIHSSPAPQTTPSSLALPVMSPVTVSLPAPTSLSSYSSSSSYSPPPPPLALPLHARPDHTPPASSSSSVYPTVLSPSPGNVVMSQNRVQFVDDLGHQHHPHHCSNNDVSSSVRYNGKYTSGNDSPSPDAHKYLSEQYYRLGDGLGPGRHYTTASTVDPESRLTYITSAVVGDHYRSINNTKVMTGGNQGRFSKFDDVDENDQYDRHAVTMEDGSQFHVHHHHNLSLQQEQNQYKSSSPLFHERTVDSVLYSSHRLHNGDAVHLYSSKPDRLVADALRSPPATMSVDSLRGAVAVADAAAVDAINITRTPAESSSASSRRSVDDAGSLSGGPQNYRIMEQVRSVSTGQQRVMLEAADDTGPPSDMSQKIMDTLSSSGATVSGRVSADDVDGAFDSHHHRHHHHHSHDHSQQLQQQEHGDLPHHQHRGSASESQMRSNVDAQRMVQESLRVYFPSVSQSPMDDDMRVSYSRSSDDGMVSYSVSGRMAADISRYDSAPGLREAHNLNHYTDGIRSVTQLSQMSMNGGLPENHHMASDPSQLVPENLCVSEPPVSQSQADNMPPEHDISSINAVNSGMIVVYDRDRMNPQNIHQHHHHLHQVPPPPLSSESPTPHSIVNHVTDSPMPSMQIHSAQSPMPLHLSSQHQISHLVDSTVPQMSLTDHPPESPLSSQHVIALRRPESPMSSSHLVNCRPVDSPTPHSLSIPHTPGSPMNSQHLLHPRHSETHLHARPVDSHVLYSRSAGSMSAHVSSRAVSLESHMLSAREQEANGLSSSRASESQIISRGSDSLICDSVESQQMITDRQDYPLPPMRTHYDPSHRLLNESSHLERETARFSSEEIRFSPENMKFNADALKLNSDSMKFNSESEKYSSDLVKYNGDVKFATDSRLKFNSSSRYMDSVYRADLQAPNTNVGMSTPAPSAASPVPSDSISPAAIVSQYYSSSYSPHSSHHHHNQQMQQQFPSYGSDGCIDKDDLMLDDKFDRIYQDVKPFDQEYPISMHVTHELQHDPLPPLSSRPPRPKKPKEPKPPRIPVVHKCNECDRMFKNSTQLKNHMWRHTGQKPFTCDQCGSKFTQQGNLRAHRRIHTGERPYECSVCKHCFTQLSTLKTHQKIHSDERPHKCTLCEAAFRQVANLKTHQVTHTGERPHKCEMCDKAFTQKSNLKAHKNRVHNPDGSFSASSRRGRKKNPAAIKPFSCMECGAKFTMMSNLKIHMKLHAGARNYSCDLCGAAFSHRTNLKSHVQRMHSYPTRKKVKCDECPASFRLKRCLKVHKRKRHPIKSLKIKILGESKYFMRDRQGPGLAEDIDESLLEEAEEGEDRSYIAEPIVPFREPKQEPSETPTSLPSSPSPCLPQKEQADYFVSRGKDVNTSNPTSTATVSVSGSENVCEQQLQNEKRLVASCSHVKQEFVIPSTAVSNGLIDSSREETSFLLPPTKDDTNQSSISSNSYASVPSVCGSLGECDSSQEELGGSVGQFVALTQSNTGYARSYDRISSRSAPEMKLFSTSSSVETLIADATVSHDNGDGDIIVPRSASIRDCSSNSSTGRNLHAVSEGVEGVPVGAITHRVDSNIASDVDNAINLVENIVGHLDTNLVKHVDDHHHRNHHHMTCNDRCQYVTDLLPCGSVMASVDASVPGVNGSLSKDMCYSSGCNESIEKVTQQLTVHLERLSEEFKQNNRNSHNGGSCNNDVDNGDTVNSNSSNNNNLLGPPLTTELKMPVAGVFRPNDSAVTPEAGMEVSCGGAVEGTALPRALCSFSYPLSPSGSSTPSSFPSCVPQEFNHLPVQSDKHT